MLKVRSQQTKQHALLLVASAVAIALFIYHSYTIISRRLRREILQVHKAVLNESLPMPIVTVQLDSHRMPNSSRSIVKIRYEAFLNKKRLPKWAFSTSYGSDEEIEFGRQDNILVNVVPPEDYLYAKKLGQWPLRMHYANGRRESGFQIIGYINSIANFTETREDGDEDVIMLKIRNFAFDSVGGTDTKNLPGYFQLFPCDDISIAIRLKHYSLMDRSESPCREDYPEDIERLLKKPLKPEDFSNSILAPELPYDPVACKYLCISKFWLPTCNCIMFPEIWGYTGRQSNMCPQINYYDMDDNCSAMNAPLSMPAAEYAKCQCYKRCEGYEFAIFGYEKIRHSPGERN